MIHGTELLSEKIRQGSLTRSFLRVRNDAFDGYVDIKKICISVEYVALQVIQVQ